MFWTSGRLLVLPLTSLSHKLVLYIHVLMKVYRDRDPLSKETTFHMACNYVYHMFALTPHGAYIAHHEHQRQCVQQSFSRYCKVGDATDLICTNGAS